MCGIAAMISLKSGTQPMSDSKQFNCIAHNGDSKTVFNK